MSEPRHEPDDGLIFDDAFVAAATVREPSAKERKGNRSSRRRAARRARKAERARHRAMVKDRCSPALGGFGTPSRRGPLAKAGMVAMVLATAAAGLALLSDRNGFGPQLIGGRNPAETRPVTDGPIPTISADDPFEGSPAARYADGAAGIVMPEPRAMAGLGKAQVADLYRRGRELIIAGRLDRTMVLGGAPDAFAKRLDPTDRRYFVRRLNHRDPKVNTRYWISSLAPHSAGLAGSVIKVHGTVKVSATGKYGRRGIMMRFNHIFVYPVYRPGDRGTLTRLVVHAETHLFGYRESGSTHLLLVKSHSSYTPARCDIDDGFIHPFFEDSAPDKVGASGRPQDPYELTPERNDATDCGASEGT